MTVSQLIEALLEISTDYGDLEVKFRAPAQEGLYDVEFAYAAEDKKADKLFVELDWS